MATNQLLPFANGAGANVETYANWSALPQVSTGFGSGLAVSKHFNYILAQGGAAGYAIGKVVVDWLGQDATIDATTLGTNFEAALEAKIGGPYLPLSGGTMTGEIVINKFATHFVSNADDTQEVGLKGGPSGNPGARIVLRGRSQVGGGGWFVLRANSTASDAVELIGKPDGNLFWDSRQIERVYDSGTYYIRFVSGVLLCWGRASIALTNKTISLPVAFADTNYSVSITAFGTTNFSDYISVISQTTSNFVLQQGDLAPGDTHTSACRWMAMGRWK